MSSGDLVRLLYGGNVNAWYLSADQFGKILVNFPDKGDVCTTQTLGLVLLGHKFDRIVFDKRGFVTFELTDPEEEETVKIRQTITRNELDYLLHQAVENNIYPYRQTRQGRKTFDTDWNNDSLKICCSENIILVTNLLKELTSII